MSPPTGIDPRTYYTISFCSTTELRPALFYNVLDPWLSVAQTVAERRRGRGAAISRCKCISTTPIGAPIYIWPLAVILLTPELQANAGVYFKQAYSRATIFRNFQKNPNCLTISVIPEFMPNNRKFV